ncbi:M15 family metallopeptidase [Frigoribacterium faeni]|uniref:M15 family metallopeptidase n=1 Tax=Frigoribacterium faeni TaxID=145483 RepID=UPI00141B4E75|nr:M15 family metallopeptidase [Frigoribacterium faeni]NIJ04171.1 LAS superfamily LD-carboxypeptidase LdcB [Frigoribacterium faeni]
MDSSVGQAEPGDTAVSGFGRRQLLSIAAVGAATAGTALALRPESARAATTLAETSTSVASVAEALEAAKVNAWGGLSNGQIPSSYLIPVVASVAGSGYLRDDAARQYLSMSLAFSNAVGRPLAITEGYRSYARQVEYWNKYQAGTGNLAAYPGTSNHGWGISCDFGAGVDQAGSAAKRWMDANAPSYGWNPTGNGFSRPEPWHFDYVGSYAGKPTSTGVDKDSDVLIIRTTQALNEQAIGYTALVGVRSLRHLNSIDMINSMRVLGVPYYEINRNQFYAVINSLGLPRASLTQNADYWRR